MGALPLMVTTSDFVVSLEPLSPVTTKRLLGADSSIMVINQQDEPVAQLCPCLTTLNDPQREELSVHNMFTSAPPQWLLSNTGGDGILLKASGTRRWTCGWNRILETEFLKNMRAGWKVVYELYIWNNITLLCCTVTILTWKCDSFLFPLLSHKTIKLMASWF